MGTHGTRRGDASFVTKPSSSRNWSWRRLTIKSTKKKAHVMHARAEIRLNVVARRSAKHEPRGCANLLQSLGRWNQALSQTRQFANRPKQKRSRQLPCKSKLWTARKRRWP